MENEGTIQTDVSTEQGERQLSPRERMMASIEEKVDGERQGQEYTPAQPAAATTTENDGVLVDDPQRYKVRVKVDGKEQELPVAELVTGYQKNATASERLRQASEKQKELEARERRLMDLEQQIKLAGSGSPSAQADATADDQLDTVFSAIAEGDTATAKEALKKVIDQGRQQTTPVDPRAVAAEVKETLASERVWDDFLRDNPEFREEYDDQGNLKPNEMREYGDYLFDKKYQPLIDKGELSYQEALSQTAEEARKAFSPPPAPQPEKTAHEQRKERKAQIDNLPTAAGAVNAGRTADPEETPGSIISQMRKARGLPA